MAYLRMLVHLYELAKKLKLAALAIPGGVAGVVLTYPSCSTMSPSRGSFEYSTTTCHLLLGFTYKSYAGDPSTVGALRTTMTSEPGVLLITAGGFLAFGLATWPLAQGLAVLGKRVVDRRRR